RLLCRDRSERRLTDSLETALRLAEVLADIDIIDGDTLTFSQHLACPNDGWSMDELAPRNFSFNSPYGACVHCDGLGTKYEVDPELVIPNPDLSIADGAIAPLASGRTPYSERLL